MFVCKLPLEGFNACLYPLDDGTFHGTIRRQHIIAHKRYPEVLNDLLLFTLNKDFQLMQEPKFLKDIPGRIKHTSWTEGLEDARIIEPGLLLAVACDTNPHWKPEMVVTRYDSHTAQLLSLQPLQLQGQPKNTEKNWLVLRRWGNEAHVLHWLHPLRVLRMNLVTGLAEILVEYPTVKELEGQDIHCGACLPITEGFLVAVRVKSGHGYSHSLWLLLDSDSYEVKGVSEPFRFDTTSTGAYEMCMSLCLPLGALSKGTLQSCRKCELQDTLISAPAEPALTLRCPCNSHLTVLKNQEIIATVSINDAWSGVWKFSLACILKGLRPVVH